ncbi:MAG: hypothetical protein KME18_07935 [Phormidium tanganyikae FI6-MK23]|jgi:hypothetical protein|nr:hypothetical protein [Phormidium tanganyikae FI6-MK23]
MHKLIALSTVISIGFTLPAAAQSCKLTQSIYRDVNGKGFELIFGQPPKNRAVYGASAVIKQAKQGVIYRFNLTQANGYGSISLIDPKRNNDNPSGFFVINFFNSDLTSAPFMPGRETSVPKYAFINGIGAAHYYDYRRDFSNNIPMLLDAMWVFDRCQN